MEVYVWKYMYERSKEKMGKLTPAIDSNKRLQYVDTVKGIAILWIVLYHLIAPCVFKEIINHLLELFLTAFFFYSGFFYKPGKRSVVENLRNRAKSLMVPFFRFSLCFWAAGSVYLVATKKETLKEAVLCLRNFYAGSMWSRVIQDWFSWEYYSLGKRYFFLADFWFLIAMLFASLIFFLIADRALRSVSGMILSVLSLFAVTGLCLRFAVSLPYNIQVAPYWAAFMLLGAFAASKKLTELPSLSDGAKWTLAVLLIGIGAVIAFLKVPSLNQFRGSFGGDELLSMLLCIAAAVPFVLGIGSLFYLIESKGLRIEKLAWLGSHSLIIYLFHVFCAWIICAVTGFSIFYKKSVSAEVLLGSILLSVCCLVLCILLGILEDKVKKLLEKSNKIRSTS